MEPIDSKTHKARGTYRKDRHGGRIDDDFRGDIGEPDDDLPETARQFWREFVASAPKGVLVAADRPALRQASWWHARVKQVERMIDDKPSNLLLGNSLIGASKEYLKWLSKLGGTPADRTKVRKAEPVSTVPDPFERLMKMTAAKN